MTTLTFDVDAFRIEFPAFANTTTYPDATLQTYWNAATCYISPEDCGVLHGACRTLALNLLTAHLTQLTTNATAGLNTQLQTAATIDKISITSAPPPLPNQWQYFLGTTPYGIQLLALLQANAVGGFFTGSFPELAAFRRVGGAFIP